MVWDLPTPDQGCHASFSYRVMLLKNPVSHSNRDAAAREEKCIRQMGRTLLELASSVEFVLGFAPRPRKTRATHELRTSYARATRELRTRYARSTTCFSLRNCTAQLQKTSAMSFWQCCSFKIYQISFYKARAVFGAFCGEHRTNLQRSSQRSSCVARA